MKLAFHAPMKPPDDPVPSGDGRMARLFLGALREAGFGVDIASAFRAYEGRGDEARQRSLAAEGAAEAARILGRYRGLAAAERPRLWFTYHLYHKAPDHLGPVVAAGLGIPYVLAEASHAPKQARGAWSRGYRLAEAAIRSARRIYCLNPADRPCLEPLVPDGVLLDLPPFIDTAPFLGQDRKEARAALGRAFGLRTDVPVILAVAMMRADQKLASYAVLAEALDALRHLSWTALIVGDGPAAGEVRRLMAPLGTRVAFAGRLEGAAIARAYAGADLYAWPSVKEAFGLAFIEAAASGLALVAGRSGGIGHIVEDGRTGFVVPAGDAAAMAGALARLLEDRGLIRDMGRAGAARASRCNDLGAASRLLGEDLRMLTGEGSEPADG